MSVAPASEPVPLADVLGEAAALVDDARRRGVPIRLLGGTAIHLRARGRLPSALQREPGDIDLVCPKGTQPEVTALLAERGYEADEAFNRLEGSRRLLFRDGRNGRQLDVFVGAFEMCHVVALDERLDVEEGTPPLAELALTKLQIVELNDKDRLDLYAMLAAHEVGDGDGPVLNAGRIAECCAGDWGLWRTCTANLDRLRQELDEPRWDGVPRELVAGRLRALQAAIDAAPKTVRWRLRAKVGDRVRWYETPDEIGEH